MRLLILPIAALLVMPVMAQVDQQIHKQCKEAKDYVGCVKAFTTPQRPRDDGLSDLRAAMKQVSARIRSGFSLRDSTLFFQPLTDQLALVSGKYPESIAVQNARKAEELFGILQAAWQSRINTLSHGSYLGTTYSCEPTKKGVEAFNLAAGMQAVTYSVQGGLFGLAIGCLESVGRRHEGRMLSYVSGLLDSGSISPEEIAEREKAKEELKAKAARERELCAMAPWNRYLDENPNMKAWAEANPKPAEARKQKFISDPNNQQGCSKAD
jgi:hypothetical protein